MAASDVRSADVVTSERIAFVADLAALRVAPGVISVSLHEEAGEAGRELLRRLCPGASTLLVSGPAAHCRDVQAVLSAVDGAETRLLSGPEGCVLLARNVGVSAPPLESVTVEKTNALQLDPNARSGPTLDHAVVFETAEDRYSLEVEYIHADRVELDPGLLSQTERVGAATRLYLFRNIIYNPALGLFCTADNRVFADPLDFRVRHERDGLERWCGDVRTRESFGWARKLEVVQEPTFWFQAIQWPYTHWFIDTLPRAMLLERVPPNARVTVSREIRGYEIDTLEFLGVDASRRLTLPGGDSSTNLLFRELYLPRPGSDVGHPGVHAEVTAWFKSLRNKLPIRRADSPPRVYLSRRDETSYRNLLNEHEVAASLRRCGYVEAVGARMTFAEKVEMFSAATKIVGVVGAGFAHVALAERADIFGICSNLYHPYHFNYARDLLRDQSAGRKTIYFGEGIPASSLRAPEFGDVMMGNWVVDVDEMEARLGERGFT
jgi:hypothetical protein